MSAVKAVRQRLSVLATDYQLTEDLATGLKLLRELCLLESGRSLPAIVRVTGMITGYGRVIRLLVMAGLLGCWLLQGY